jgi:hypothetical protein
MELKNMKLVAKQPAEEGTTKSGKGWRKQLFIVEDIESQWPKKVALTAWNEVVDKLDKVSEQTPVSCAIRLESREYKEKWYTDVVCWKLTTDEKADMKKEPANDLPF